VEENDLAPDLTLEQVMEKVHDLPTLPDVFFKVNEVVNDPNTSAQDLERIIESDVAISAKLLRLVNSASYGLSRKVDSLMQAIPILGFYTVQNLVMSVSIFEMNAMPAYDLKAFWKHSFATGTVAKAIADADGMQGARSQALAGLLHDIGKAFMLQDFLVEHQGVRQEMLKDNISFIEAEKRILSTTHAEIGGAIAEKWNFPPNLTAAIRYHHEPELAEYFKDFAAVTGSANAICQLTETGYLHDEGFETSAQACEGYHPLKEPAYNQAMREMEKQAQFFEAFIDQMETARKEDLEKTSNPGSSRKANGTGEFPGVVGC
jgi:putative nucleotidyltransferase with HDIG domain